MRELVSVLGRERALHLAQRAARLTGLQHYAKMAGALGAEDAGVVEAAQFLVDMMSGMGDYCELEVTDGEALIRHGGLRVLRDLQGEERQNLLACWLELWKGAVHSHRKFMQVDVVTTPAGSTTA